ncbi:hypothetical protein BDA96_02G213400 [Sorghum bicolor]|uniref:WRKY domain-containing protein n=1 Tax=Sorghum bicolor TaxID=4558 RepID=A0A921RQ22_SORBI|nr:hypothetical protein BDA96_02G213400 [Sorghum bicolor]
MAMDSTNGECSSPTASAVGLLPLFGPSRPPPQAESLEEKLRRVSEENRRLATALDAILAADRSDHPRALATSPPAQQQGNAALTTQAAAGVVVTAEPRPKVRTVRAEPADADANHLKDGYHWRKYGQKVTRDNPYPRAYFRCAYAPSCPVKKKVQRSADDNLMLVATYEGEHNHEQHAQSEYSYVNDASTSQQQHQAGGSSSSTLPCSIISINSLGRTITLGLADQRRPGSSSNAEAAAVVVGEIVTPELRKVLVDELASLLKNDPEFIESLATAVADRVMERIPAAGHIL